MSESKAPTIERYDVSGCGDRNCDPLMGSQEGWLVEFDAYEAMRLERDQLKAECEGLRVDAELAAKKLRSAEICHPRAVETLVDEARAALEKYLPEGWPESAMGRGERS
jgi:hypothetical protein